MAFQAGAALDWKAACEGGLTHRFRQTAGQQSGERRYGWEDNSVLGQRVVEAGVILRIDEEGRPSVIEEAEPLDCDWSF